MDCNHLFLRSLAWIAILLPWHCDAQSSRSSTTLARQLDSLLQDYAYRAFFHQHPRTGIAYDGDSPSNLTGVEIAVIRLRCGSLRTRGVASYKEFDVPTGVVVHPYVKRLALVYQNLGNWSSFYYSLPGYSYLAPILGLLAYSAANLSAISLPELEIMASSLPITINFSNARPVPSGLTAKCVWFSLNGSVELTDPFASNVCSTFRQGHFSIVVNSTLVPPAPAPAPAAAQVPAGFPMTNPVEEHKSKAWKIAVSVVVGFVGILLLSLLVTWLVSNRKKKEFIEMQKREDAGEILRMGRVGNTRLPMAPMTRTQPVIESGYVA